MNEIQNITDINQDIVGEILLQITLIKKEKTARQDKETINGFFNWMIEMDRASYFDTGLIEPSITRHLERTRSFILSSIRAQFIGERKK